MMNFYYATQPVASTVVSTPDARVYGDTAYAKSVNAALENGGITQIGDMEIHAIMGILKGGYSELTNKAVVFIGGQECRISPIDSGRIQITNDNYTINRILSASDVDALIQPPTASNYADGENRGETMILHRDAGTNKYEKIALCGADGGDFKSSYRPDPAGAIPCEDCTRISQERAAKRAAAAQAQINAQKAKMDQFSDPQIFD